MLLARVLGALVALHVLYGFYIVIQHAGPTISAWVDAVVAEEEEREAVQWLSSHAPPPAPEWDAEWGLRRLRADLHASLRRGD